jgi:hypothetical protein
MVHNIGKILNFWFKYAFTEGKGKGEKGLSQKIWSKGYRVVQLNWN